MQWQMYCADIEDIIYMVFWSSEDFFVTECRRNADFIAEAKLAAEQFYDWMLQDIEPPDEYIFVDGCEEQLKIDQLYRFKAMEQEAKARINEIKEYFLSKSDYQPVKCGPLTIQKQEVRGAVDYAAIPELSGVDLDQYRKPEFTKYVMTVRREI
jgi:hypothetical protein